MSKVKSEQREISRISIPVFLIAFQIACIPFIVRLNILPVDSEAINVWNGESNWDFFSYYKSVFTIVIGAILFLIFIADAVASKYRIKLSYLFMAVLSYTIFIIASAILSEYPHTSMFGFPDHYEGLFSLLAYIVLFVCTIYFVKNERQMVKILKVLLISATIISLIGILQYFGFDLYKSSFGQNLIVPNHYGDLSNLIKYQAEERLTMGYVIYSSMFNPNAFGLYISMLFPLCLFLFLHEEKKQNRIILGCLTCLLFANLIGSFSRGSYVGVFISIVITIALFRKLMGSKWKLLLFICIPLALIYLGMNLYSSGSINMKILSMANQTENHAEDIRIDKIKNFTIDGKELLISSTNSVLKLSIVDGNLNVADENNNNLMLEMINDEGGYEILDERYVNYKLTVIDNLLKVQKGKSFLYFVADKNGFAFLDNKGTVLSIESNIEKAGFEGYERLGSGRGYIWSRTLPILKETVFIGTGPDTFPMEFPQKDIMGKLNYMYDAYLIIDKPHNMYLQTAVNTGILSLLSLLSIFILFIVQSIKHFRKSERVNPYMMLMPAIFSSIVAYLIAAFFTDSTVSVAPIFWVLLGLGFGVNKRISQWKS